VKTGAWPRASLSSRKLVLVKTGTGIYSFECRGEKGDGDTLPWGQALEEEFFQQFPKDVAKFSFRIILNS